MTSAAPSFGPQEVPLANLSGELLRARVARAQMYLIEMTPAAGAPAPGPSLQRDRLAYLYALEQQNRLYAAGPVETSIGSTATEMAVIAASSLEDAEAIARDEPGNKAGACVNTVRSYTINEGVACYVARAMSKRVQPGGGGVAQATLSLEALQAKAVGAELFAVDLVPADKPRPPEDTATMDAHFVWLRENEMGARLVGCGPLQSTRPLVAGAWGGGLGILATSRAEAEQIAAAEPSGVAGYRKLSVRAWTVNYGVAAPIAKALQKLNALS